MLKNMALPEIPQSALERKQLLNEILKAAGEPFKWAPLLIEVKRILDANSLEKLPVLFDQIEKEGLLEECAELFRNSAHNPSVRSSINYLDELLIRHRRKRAIHPEEEPTYRYRLTYAKGSLVAILGTPELQRIFLRAFQSVGVLFKYDFSKHPKPMIELAPLLAPGATGLNEFIDFQCRYELPISEKEFLGRLSMRLPSGLMVKSCARIPTFASSISELASCGHWLWTIDESIISKESIVKRIQDFYSSTTFMLASPNGRESICDLRLVIYDLRIQGDAVVWSTDLTYLHSPNPLRSIAQVLGIESNQIRGLGRTSLTLNEDIRLKQSDKFSRKLKNIYEDATILDDDSSIAHRNDEDDDYITLG